MRHTIRQLALGAALTAMTANAAWAAFPAGFRWGTAIAGFQVEMGGPAPQRDAGSDWWAWVHDGKNRCDPPNNPPACVARVTKDLPENGPDYYERYAADHKLAAKKLKNNTLRLSIEWSRIFPTSTAGVASGDLVGLNALADQAEVAHYRAVLQSLRAFGLEPFVTLNHFALPTWIHDPIATRDTLASRDPGSPLPAFTDPAGWLDDDIVGEFQKYAQFVGATFGDLVDVWAPLNEPLVVAVNGYVNIPGVVSGNFPPGAWSFTGAVKTIANEVYANAVAYDAVKLYDTVDADADGTAAVVGIVHNMVAFHPSNPSSAGDIAGAQHASYIFNSVFPNAVFNGDLDLNVNGVIDPGEHDNTLAGKADFFGVNYYLRATATSLGGPITPVIPLLDFLPALSYGPNNCPSVCTEFGWEIYPQGLREVLTIAGSYGRPVYITENGISDSNEDQRPYYLVQHLQVMEQAIADGVADVRGYYHWSLVDNFEWSSGFQQDFGLYAVNPLDPLHKRKLRKGGRLYGKIVKKNVIPAPLARKYGL